MEKLFSQPDKGEYFPHQFFEGAKLSLCSFIDAASEWVPESSTAHLKRAGGDQKCPTDNEDEEGEYAVNIRKSVMLRKTLSPGLYEELRALHTRLGDLGLVAKFSLLNIRYVKSVSSFTSYGPRQVLNSTIFPIKAVNKRENIIPGWANYVIDHCSGLYRCLSVGFTDLIVENESAASIIKGMDVERKFIKSILKSGRIHSFDLEFGVDIRKSLLNKNTNSYIKLPPSQALKHKILLRLETDYIQDTSQSTRWVIADVDKHLQNSIMGEAGDPVFDWIASRKRYQQ